MSAAPSAGLAPTKPKYSRDECEDRYRVVRTVIVSCWPYLAAAAFRLCVRWEPRCPTLGVDRAWRLYINPDFFMAMPVSKAACLVAGHELQHALLGHADRLTELRDVMLVADDGTRIDLPNVAFDLAINSSLRDFADSAAAYQAQIGRLRVIPIEVPDKPLMPQHFHTPDGKPFPIGLIGEAYAELLLTFPKNQSGGGSGKGGKGAGNDKSSGKGAGKCPAGDDAHAACGKCGSGGGQTPQEWEERSDPTHEDGDSGVTSGEQSVIRRQVAQAVQEHAAKYRGTVPAGLELFAKVQMTPPKVDWRRETRAMVRSSLNWVLGLHDYTYTRRNKRQLPGSGRVILPGFRQPLPQVVVVLDTSGSMGHKDYAAAFSEVRGVFRSLGLLRVPVVTCDAEAHQVQWITRVQDLKLTGGGGTDMVAGIESAVEQTKVRLVIVMTDAYTPWPSAPIPGVRVVACVTQPKGKAPAPPEWIRTVYCADDGAD